MLRYNDTQLAIIRKIIARLEALYVDQEKSNELADIIQRTDTAASKNDMYSNMELTEEHKPELEELTKDIQGIMSDLEGL